LLGSYRNCTRNAVKPEEAPAAPRLARLESCQSVRPAKSRPAAIDTSALSRGLVAPGADDHVAADLIREAARRLVDRVGSQPAAVVVGRRLPRHAFLVGVFEERAHVLQLDPAHGTSNKSNMRYSTTGVTVRKDQAATPRRCNARATARPGARW
jgi:hypothetical protein